MRRPSKARNGIETMPLGLIPPQNVDVEVAVLGGILIDSQCLDYVGGELNETLFYEPKHTPIINAILSVYRRNEPVDILTVTAELKKMTELESAGGAVYVSQLTSRVASSSNIEIHVKILQESSLKRRIIRAAQDSLKQSYNPEEDAFEIYNKTIKTLEDSVRSVVHYPVKKIGAVARENHAEQLHILNTGERSGVPSHLRYVDNLTNGWQKSDLIILAGRPGMGKTAFALTVAYAAAETNKIPVAFFSLEMSAAQLVGRIESKKTQISSSEIIKKQLNEDQLSALIKLEAGYDEVPFYIDDTPSISIFELTSKARMMHREYGIQLLVVDYLQLMTSGLKTNNRNEEIAEISRSLKALAKELNIPVIALSQLSRNVEQRGGDKKPHLSDLRESGQIEQDADMVMFCYRPEYYGIQEYMLDGDPFPASGLFLLIVAKHRNGSTGEIPLKFVKELATVTNGHFNFTNDAISDNNSTFVQEDEISKAFDDFSEDQSPF